MFLIFFLPFTLGLVIINSATAQNQRNKKKKTKIYGVEGGFCKTFKRRDSYPKREFFLVFCNSAV